MRVALPGHILQLCCSRKQQPNASLCCKEKPGPTAGDEDGATVPPDSSAAPGMGHSERRGEAGDSPALLPGLETPVRCQQQTGHIQLVPLSSDWGPTTAAGPPGRETCPARHSGKGAPCLGELSRHHGTLTAGWTVTIREKLSRGPAKRSRDNTQHPCRCGRSFDEQQGVGTGKWLGWVCCVHS